MNMHVPTPKIKTHDGNTVSRRSILGAAPAAGLAAFLIGATPVKAAPAHDPLPGWFAEWKRIRAEWETAGHDETGEETAYGEDLWAQTDMLEVKMSTTMAITPQGAQAQLEWMLADSADADFQRGHREALVLALDAMKGGVS